MPAPRAASPCPPVSSTKSSFPGCSPRATSSSPRTGASSSLSAAAPPAATSTSPASASSKTARCSPTRAVSLDVCGDGERGLLGLALDPNFSSNGYLYVYYTRQAQSGQNCAYQTYSQGLPGPRNRISRLTMTRRHDRPGQRGRADRQYRVGFRHPQRGRFILRRGRLPVCQRG